MKFGLIPYGLPTLLTTWAIWGWVTRLTASLGSRRVTLALTMLVTASYYCLLRLDGVTGAMNSELSWRWSPTAEETFLATAKRSTEETPTSTESASAEIVALPGDWIGFRGPNRDGIVTGVRIDNGALAWKAAPHLFPKRCVPRRSNHTHLSHQLPVRSAHAAEPAAVLQPAIG